MLKQKTGSLAKKSQVIREGAHQAHKGIEHIHHGLDEAHEVIKEIEEKEISKGGSAPVKKQKPFFVVGIGASAGGYEASFGTYEIDEAAHHFTFHVEGALVRTLVGKDLTRVFEFSGKQLIVKSAIPDEHWRVAWEHF